jgi:hypothetical protein
MPLGTIISANISMVITTQWNGNLTGNFFLRLYILLEIWLYK